MPSPVPVKNQIMSPSVIALNLGDQLQQQVEDQENELKKKKNALQPSSSLLGMAANALGLTGAGGG